MEGRTDWRIGKEETRKEKIANSSYSVYKISHVLEIIYVGGSPAPPPSRVNDSEGVMASVSCQESEFEESTGSDDFTQPLLGRRPRDNQRRCCKAYKIRRLKSNAAVLVLLWNLLVFSYQFESLRSILKLFPSQTLGDPWLAVFLTMCFKIPSPDFSTLSPVGLQIPSLDGIESSVPV